MHSARSGSRTPGRSLHGTPKALPFSPQNATAEHIPASPSSNLSVEGSECALSSPPTGMPAQGLICSEAGTHSPIDEDYTSFHKRHIADVAQQLAAVLEDIVAQNDVVPFSANKLTRFHSRAPPGISIRNYLMRIIKFCNLEKAVLLVVLFLLDLFTSCYPKFVLNSLTVHRFLITACTVAAKGLCDQFCSNTHYAKVGGLSVMELNLLEVEFLTRVRYRIVPPPNTLARYDHLLMSKEIEPSDSKKHPLEDKAGVSQPKPPGKPSGNKGFKAMKETFKFLHTKRK